MEQLSRGEPEARSVVMEAASADPNRRAAQHNNLANDSAGQVNPQYLFASRPVGRLACGELAAESRLGLVRVTAVLPSEEIGDGDDRRGAFVQIGWSDDNGPCHAAGLYREDHLLAVRVPSYADRMLVRRGIDQASRAKREISGAVARLIAAHIHAGPRSAVYGFAVNGAVPEQLFDELDYVSTNQPVYRPWVSALARFCVEREDCGTVAGWGTGPPVPASLTQWPSAGERNGRGRRRPTNAKAVVGPLTSRRLSAETAVQLMDAAFALGLTANRSEALAAKARLLGREQATAGRRSQP